LRTRLMCLFTLLLGALLVRPALAQQSDTPQTTSAPVVQIARTTDDLRERILLDRIDELEKRITDLEERSSSTEPAAAQDAASASAAPASPAPAATPAPAAAAAPQDSSTPTPAPQAAAAPAAAPTWSVGPIDFSGTVDGYYNLNFNHPGIPGFKSNANETNILYNFNIPANTFSLNLVKLGMTHMPDPIGFEFDLGYGETMTTISSVSTDTGFDKFVEQAYVSFKPAKAKGFEADFGKFVTTAGAEVIESYSNWNYSRSLLFAWAIPYYHFGLRTTMPVGKHWVVGGQLVNGWNNSVDNNTGKTLGVTLAGTYAKYMYTFNYYGGPENTGTNAGWKHLFDTEFMWMPTSKFNTYLNYDYGEDALHNFAPFTSNRTGRDFVKWQGVAWAMHYQATSKWALASRLEWFDDPDGFAMFGANSLYTFANPVKQQVKEFTGTVEYKFLEGLLWRGEYRYDWSNQPFFVKGMPPCDESGTFKGCPGAFGLGNSKNQSTLTFALVAYFGPKR
jgi:hypothetical protein